VRLYDRRMPSLDSLDAVIRSRIRRLYNTSSRFRRSLVLLQRTVRRNAFDLSHLAWYREDDADGPLQREEALMLFGLLRVLRPAVVVEFGFLRGRSALNFLLALPESSRLYSFDIDPQSQTRALTEFSRFPNFTYRHKPQERFAPEDVDSNTIDFVLLDGAHEVDTNIATFEALHGLLAEDALVVVHDTGLWARSCFGPTQERFAAAHSEGWLSPDRYGHRPEEREFVNWLLDNHPEFGRLQLESTRTLRHGMTLLQRQGRLATTAPARATPAAPRLPLRAK